MFNEAVKHTQVYKLQEAHTRCIANHIIYNQQQRQTGLKQNIKTQLNLHSLNLSAEMM